MNFLYRLYYILCYPFIHIVYFFRCRGKENLPEGPCIICANHSSYADAVLALLAFGIDNGVHVMAKADLFDKFFLGAVLRSVECIPINRDEDSDIKAIRTCITYLRDGKKIMIFPEGTRVHKKGEAPAKEGPVRIAEKTKTPVVPMFITPDKKLFHHIKVIIGKPYMIEKPADRNFKPAADDLLDRIYDLGNAK